MKSWKEKTIRLLASVKKGFADVKAVCAEGNYKLFLKQAIFVLLVIFAFRYLSNVIAEKNTNVLGKISAVQAQKDNEKEYLANKKKLLELEPRFPDISTKNEWLLRQLVAVFREASLRSNIGSNQTENTTNSGYTVVQIPVDLTLSYGGLGKFLADIENREEYLRVTEFSIEKKSEQLGQNTVRLKIETVFPKEKISDSMFKDKNKESKK